MKITIGGEEITVPFFISQGAASDKELKMQFDAFLKELLTAQARKVRASILAKEQEILFGGGFDGFFQSFEKMARRRK